MISSALTSSKILLPTHLLTTSLSWSFMIGGICLKSPAKITLSFDSDATYAALGSINIEASSTTTTSKLLKSSGFK